MKYSGADWIERQGKPMSEFGKLVADILGQAYQGIYHIDRNALRVDWSRAHNISINVYAHGLATFDSNHLTILVLLCHDNAVRLEVLPSGPRLVRLLFSKRQKEGDTYHRHPTIEESVELVRTKYALPEPTP